MTIQTLTSEATPGLTAAGAPVGGHDDVSISGLPDIASLARMAGEFFAALPGQGGGLPAGLNHLASRSDGPAAALSSAPASALSAPASAPTASRMVPANLPDASAPASSPALPVGALPARAGFAQGVPEAYAAALPSIAPPNLTPPSAPASAVPSTPYYFLGGGSAAQSGSQPQRDDLGVEDRVTARSFGLPGEDDLKALLVGNAGASAPHEPDNAATVPGFYFLHSGLPAAGQQSSGVPALPASRGAFDVHAVRRDFPILQERVNGRQLVWFDNAATTHKPQSVIDRLAYFYAHENSNIHRAAHELAARATDAYEAARNKVARFIGAGSAEEIVFVRGTTEAINLIAKTWGVQNVGEGDEIVVSHLEHHANIVPWQQLAQEKGATLRVIPVDDSGQILLDEARKLITDRVKIVAVTQVSNALGTVTPVRELVAMAHAVGAKALVDGAQSVSHMRVNVHQLDADFFVFSGHKIFGPTGIGAVYAKRAILETMPPWQGGGNMIADVTFERTVYQPPPNRFEAGTGNIADAVGLGAALDYVDRIGIEAIGHYEHDLLEYATHGLKGIPGLRLIGTAAHKASVASFVLRGYSTNEVGQALNREGIAVRTGHHCAQPILRRFGLEATVRPSLAFYNTCEEVDRLVSVVHRLATAKR